MGQAAGEGKLKLGRYDLRDMIKVSQLRSGFTTIQARGNTSMSHSFKIIKRNKRLYSRDIHQVEKA